MTAAFGIADHFERDSATVGIVDSVGPSRIDISLFDDAPHGISMNAGQLQRFPRVNGFVAIPAEAGAMLAMITWLGIDTASISNDAGPDRLSLPAPRRRLHVLPLGVLRSDPTTGGYSLVRGALSLPTVGDPVRLPTKSQLRALVPQHAAPSGEPTGIRLGSALLAGGGPVIVSPDRLFGRHLAVLGNTGSGKSCTTAHLLREAALLATAGDANGVGFRAILFDLNNEYGHCFDDFEELGIEVKRLSASPDETQEQLRVPAWMWDDEEWLSFASASPGTQAPLLRHALSLVHQFGEIPTNVALTQTAGAYYQLHRERMLQTTGIEVGTALGIIRSGIDQCRDLPGADIDGHSVNAVVTTADQILPKYKSKNPDYEWGYKSLNSQEADGLIDALGAMFAHFGIALHGSTEHRVDTKPFEITALIELLPIIAASRGAEFLKWTAPMIERLRTAVRDPYLDGCCIKDGPEAPDTCFQNLFGSSGQGRLTIIDLSMLPNHALWVIAGAITRAMLKSLQRNVLDGHRMVPTIMVLDEAHSLIRRGSITQVGDDSAPGAARLCRERFETVAREGRKFGLSLVISSQRPGEVSETVLSQCNTYLIHRIVNDRDQEYLRRLVPDSLSSLMSDLPTLPTRTAICTGWAVELPTIVEISELAPQHRPRSSDPDFGASWAEGRTLGAL